MNANITFQSYQEQWIEDILDKSPDPKEIRQRFARKILSQWQDINDVEETWISIDELSDLGIDLAYFQAGKIADDGISGDTWFLVKSCYNDPLHPYKGSFFDDGRKILEMIDKKQDGVSDELSEFFKTLEGFWLKSVDKFTNDRIVIVFASDKPINDKQTIEIKKLLEYAHNKLGTMIDIEFISIKTIYINAVKENEFSETNPLKISMTANLSNSDTNLLVGTIKLRDLYWFLRDYKIQTGNLDQIFEKNIRRFLGLGSDRPINQAMQSTLIHNPAQFGLYNNGVTIVVEGFAPETTDSYSLFEPYIVNGCQTTRTIWEVFRQKYEAGRDGLTPELINWQRQIADGLVVIKIVKVGNEGEKLLHNITKYTNSQNAVKERDFITLEKGFEYLQSELATKYDVFLEIQRGEWDSQKAWQKSSTSVHQFSKYANTFELLKVYGAGWLREAATAFSSNEKFLPGGDLYRQIVLDRRPPFNVDDLYAAYQLSMAGTQNNFGRKATKHSRRQTRYLFYLITIDLLKDIMIRVNISTSSANITNAILKLTKNKKKDAWNTLIEFAVNTTDEYLNQLEEDSIFNEPIFDTEFNRNLSAYLKSNKLGQAESSPRFASLIAINKRTMGRGQPSPRDIITEIINS